METTLFTGAGKIKAAIIAIGTYLTSKFGVLFLPLLLLIICSIIDYIMGILAAHHRGETIRSKKGFAGISKKISMWLLVGVGVILDLLLEHLFINFGWQPPLNLLVASLVCVWLLTNEIISILESADDIGLNVPPFLMKMIVWIKNKTENEADFESDEDKDIYKKE